VPVAGGEVGGEVVSVRNVKTVKARASITLKSAPNGFSVTLPANHGYTSYRLIDLRGREIRRGRIGDETNLRFNNINRSVIFLKLEGKRGGAPMVLKAVTY